MAWRDRLSVEACVGDLLAHSADGLVCNVNTNLALNYSIGRQVRQVGGERLIREIEAVARQLPGEKLMLGEAVIVKTSALPAASYLILVAWWDRDNEYTHYLLHKAIISSIRQALSHGMRSLAMPILGIGSGRITAVQFADGLIRVVHDLERLADSESFCLNEITVVSDRRMDIEVIDQYLARRL